MNKSQLLQYLHDCLAKGRRPQPGDTLVILAEGLASRVLATRGLAAELSTGDRIALDRQWGQPGLADRVARAIAEAKQQPPDLETFVDQSIEASLSYDIQPTGDDAEQAAKVRLLAAASLSFQAAKNLSVGDIGVDQFVAEIGGGQGLPDSSDSREPLPLPYAPAMSRSATRAPTAEEIFKESVWVINLQQVGGHVCPEPSAGVALAGDQQAFGSGLADTRAIKFTAWGVVGHACKHAMTRQG